MTKTTKIAVKRYVGMDSLSFDGVDEGGKFLLVNEEIPTKLLHRMRRCTGCRDDFYNRRANTSGATCWMLDKDDCFSGKGRPKCYC
jgi:hypothetical protein